MEERAEDAEPRFALAAVSLGADDYASALEQVAELIRRAPDFRSSLPRRALVAIPETLEPDEPLARRFRQSLFDR